jgi:hypothetical protein
MMRKRKTPGFCEPRGTNFTKKTSMLTTAITSEVSV